MTVLRWAAHSQIDQPCFRRLKTAPLVQPNHQFIRGVHVKPVSTTAASVNCFLDQSNSYALSPPIGVDGQVQQEEVDVAIPGHVHKADELITAGGAHPSKTVIEDSGIALLGRAPRDCEQGLELGRADALPPCEADRVHAASLMWAIMRPKW